MAKQPQSGGAVSGEAREMTMPFDFKSFLNMNNNAIDSMGEVNQKLYEGVSAYNEEVVNFVNGRLKEDFAVPKQLMNCETPQQVYGVYMDFFQKAAQQYLSEAERLTSLGSKIAGETFQAMEHQAEEVAKMANDNGDSK